MYDRFLTSMTPALSSPWNDENEWGRIISVACKKSASVCSDRKRFASSQWETALLCNDVSHWLSAGLESVLKMYCKFMILLQWCVKHKPRRCIFDSNISLQCIWLSKPMPKNPWNLKFFNLASTITAYSLGNRYIIHSHSLPLWDPFPVVIALCDPPQ